MKLFSNKQSCCYYVLPSGVHFVECKVGGFFFAFFCFFVFFFPKLMSALRVF